MINALYCTVVTADAARIAEMLNISMEPDLYCCTFWVIGERKKNGSNLIVMGAVFKGRDN